MTLSSHNPSICKKAVYNIGWDVGGWNCDKNPRSRDAIVILNPKLSIVGAPWRGNLRPFINEAQTTGEWIAGLFALCGVEEPAGDFEVCLAIDTPLAFSDDFNSLVTQRTPVAAPLESSQDNPYLYRQTERLLFAHGLRPLSAVKDLIGSQATKGMHVLAKFAPQTASCGVWTDWSRLTAVEAYPSACKNSATIAALRANYQALGDSDRDDALICALIAFLFHSDRDKLWGPPGAVPASEGWIWIPRDVIISDLPAMGGES
jgi:hypothetical protein